MNKFIKFFTGSTYQVPRIDPGTFSIEIVSHLLCEVHGGHAFCAHHYETDFDKASEIGILFTTPNTVEWLHAVAYVYCGAAALFEILEAPTVDTGNYPSSFKAPHNRNRNSGNSSNILSVRAVPVVNQFSQKLKADAAPVTADGDQIHAETIGSGKQGGGGGNSDDAPFILKRNTTYYFRLKGLTVGSDNVVASMYIIWSEHTNLE